MKTQSRNRRRGAVIVVTLLVVFAMASIVLVMCSSMRVEASSAANLTASIQASTIELGAEQYVKALLMESRSTLSSLDDGYFAGVRVGDGYFWILRPNYGDPNLSPFGLTDEGGKLNLNTATYESLMRLPNMTDELASAIVEWRGGAAAGTTDGYYSNYGYAAKKGSFETVEEMLLVEGASRQLLYGGGGGEALGMYSNLGQGSAGSQGPVDLANAYGIYDLLTVYSSESGGGTASAGGGGGAGGASGAPAGGGKVNISDRNSRSALQALLENKLGDKSRAAQIIAQMGRDTYDDVFDFYFGVKLTVDEFALIYDSITASPSTNRITVVSGGTGGQARVAGGTAPVATQVTKGRINVNTAPRDVLFCIAGLDSTDVDNLISARQGTAAGSTNVAWVAGVLDQKMCHGLAAKITGASNQYSADILAVSANGRSYKRVRIVVDVSGSTPQVIYRRDFTDRGWPMDPRILSALRTGQGSSLNFGNGRGMSGGMTR